MPSWVELNRSRIEHVESNERAARIELDASLQVWAPTEGQWRGRCFIQRVHLKVTSGVEAFVRWGVLPLRIKSGELHVGESRFENLIPFPFQSREPLELRLALETGDVVSIRGQGVSVEAAGDRRFVADVPIDFLPTPIARAAGILASVATTPEAANIRASFNLRYRRAVVTWILWGLVFLGVVLLPPGLSTGRRQLQGPLDYIFLAGLVGLLLFHAWNWRCPACRKYLGNWLGQYDECRSCKVRLR